MIFYQICKNFLLRFVLEPEALFIGTTLIIRCIFWQTSVNKS